MPAISDYRDILVIVETHENKIRKASLEVLTKARELGDQLGARVNALVMGDAVSELGEVSIHAGADFAFLAEHELLTTGNVDAHYAAALPVIKEQKPEIVLMSATSLGLDLGPRLAAALGTGALSDATKFEIDETDRLLVAKRLTYDGSVEAVATIPKHRPQIASLRPGAVRVGYPDDSRYGRVERVEVNVPKSAQRVTLASLEDAPPLDVPLENAEIVVTGGLGFVSPEDWKDPAKAELAAVEFAMVKDLARALGGAWGATRAAVQFGLAPPERQVGATGKNIAPKLYIACGISGQFEHFVGIREAGVIVGINPDKGAPLFKYANYGIVGDAKEVIPRIIHYLTRE